jgi:hypothetical protein
LSRLRWTPHGLLTGQEHDPGSIRLFRPDGTRESGTGEHIVYVQPSFQGHRVLPRSTIQVWSWEASTRAPDPLAPRAAEAGEHRPRSWRLVSPPLEVFYDERLR